MGIRDYVVVLCIAALLLIWYISIRSQSIRCRLCKVLFHRGQGILDVWDREWIHCPFCTRYGKPEGSDGASGGRIQR